MDSSLLSSSSDSDSNDVRKRVSINPPFSAITFDRAGATSFAMSAQASLLTPGLAVIAGASIFFTNGDSAENIVVRVYADSIFSMMASREVVCAKEFETNSYSKAGMIATDFIGFLLQRPNEVIEKVSSFAHRALIQRKYQGRRISAERNP